MNNKVIILTKRIFEQFINKETKEKVSLIAKAPIFALMLIIISKESAFIEFNETNTLLFVLSCSAFFIGMSNTLQEVCKERSIVKRELQSKSYSAVQYILSKLVMLCVMGLIQSVFLIVPLKFALNMPETGVLMDSYLIEILITTFLSIVSAGTMALLVSASSRTTEQTMGIMPLLILVQIIFSGVIIKIDKPIMKIASYFTISKWSMEAYGTSTNINTMHEKIQNIFYTAVHEPKLAYLFEDAHLMKIWGVLVLMVVLFAALSVFAVREIMDDGR